MFDIKKFGGYLSKLRKNADMTQSSLAERLNVTRQAVSNYERGDSFPDVSILVLTSEIFGVGLTELINAGEPTKGEAGILYSVATGQDNIHAESFKEIAALAPILKPSVLEKLSEGFSKQGIDISNIVSLAEYLNDGTVIKLLENASFNVMDSGMLEKLIPFLDSNSKYTLFQRILEGEVDYHILRTLLPYFDFISSPIEAAVIDGALPLEALDILREGLKKNERNDRFGRG